MVSDIFNTKQSLGVASGTHGFEISSSNWQGSKNANFKHNPSYRWFWIKEIKLKIYLESIFTILGLKVADFTTI